MIVTADGQAVIQFRIDSYPKGSPPYPNGCNYRLGGKVYHKDFIGPCACHDGLIRQWIDGKTAGVSFKGNILGIGLRMDETSYEDEAEDNKAKIRMILKDFIVYSVRNIIVRNAYMRSLQFLIERTRFNNKKAWLRHSEDQASQLSSHHSPPSKSG
jgi:hypothetical protein